MKKLLLVSLLIILISNLGFSQTCSPSTVITMPFTKDGAGQFCYETPCIGTPINSWNMIQVTINGVDFTNKWADASSLPAPINGKYYIVYNGAYAWSHFDAAGKCSVSTDAPTAAPTGVPTPVPSGVPTPVATPTQVPVYYVPYLPTADQVSLVPSEATGQMFVDIMFPCPSYRVADPGSVAKAAGVNPDGTTYMSNITVGTKIETYTGICVQVINPVRITYAISYGDTTHFGFYVFYNGKDQLVKEITVTSSTTPSTTVAPTSAPTDQPTTAPTVAPTETARVTATPNNTPVPTAAPTVPPTAGPTAGPTVLPPVNVRVVLDCLLANGTVSWSQSLSLDVISYNLYRSCNAGGPYTLIGSVAANSTTTAYSFKDQTSGSNCYHYVVTAVGSSNVESAYSAEGTVIAPDCGTTGRVWITPTSQTVLNGTTGVKIVIHTDTGTYLLAAYGILVTYDSAILGSPAVLAESTGFVTAVNTNNSGSVNVVGFDTSGKGPSSDLAVFDITFTAIGAGTSTSSVAVNSLVDPSTATIGTPNGIGCTISVN